MSGLSRTWKSVRRNVGPGLYAVGANLATDAVPLIRISDFTREESVELWLPR